MTAVLEDTKPVTPGQSAGLTPQQAQFTLDREAGYVFSAVHQLTEKHGQVQATLQHNCQNIAELRTSVDNLSSKASFVKGAIWVFGGLMLVLGIVWTPIIQPGLAQAIAKDLKPHIERQIDTKLQESQAQVKPKK